jgi:hypothetical protein
MPVLAALPQPPIHAVMPKTAQGLFTAFIFAPLGAMLIYAVRRAVRDRDPLMLLCIAGGALAMAFEPIVDVIGMCFFPRTNQWVAFEAFGRAIPLFIVFVYPWFVGGQGYIAYRVFAKGTDRRGVFGLWAAFAVANVFLESPGIIAHVYSYYGRQPLNPWGFPLWWAFVNPVMPLVVGALVFKLRPHFGSGWALLAVIPLIPMADGVANGATAWPVWITLNTGLSVLWTTLAAFASLGLALYVAWIISVAVASPTPLGVRASESSTASASGEDLAAAVRR